MKNTLWQDIIAGIAKWWYLIVYIAFGAITEALNANKKKPLTWIENASRLAACCLVGGTFAYICIVTHHDKLSLLTGLVTMVGNNIVTFMINYTKNPEKIKELIVNFLKRNINN